jgi:K+-transporting ATPase ATPase A chain
MAPLLWQQGLLIVAVILAVSITFAWWVEWIEGKEDRGEAFLSKFLRIDLLRTQSGWGYLLRILLLSAGVFLWVFAAGLAQGWLPMNPDKFAGLPLLHALHLAMAVTTHTNWQPFAPEKELTPFTQAFATCLGNFLVGTICVAAWRSLVKALSRQPIGNAWAGIYRGILILLPVQIILTAILISQGVCETLTPKHNSEGLVATFAACSVSVGAGPGWTSDNAFSTIENPSTTSDMALLAGLVALPVGFCFATGGLIKRRKLMVLLTLVMLGILLAFTCATQAYTTNLHDKPRWALSESLWLNATAGSGNGSQNAAVENFQPMGRLTPFLTLLGGLPLPPALGIGVGTLLMYLLIATYLAALMAGRSPEFLGFKTRMGLIGATAVGTLGPPLLLLCTAAFLVLTPAALALFKTNGPYGMSALLWAIGSWTQNNGSAMSLATDAPIFIQTSIAVMGIGRIMALFSVVMLAGAIAQQKDDPALPPSVEPDGAVMLGFWVAVMLVGAVLSMLPLIMMGPLLEAIK